MSTTSAIASTEQLLEEVIILFRGKFQSEPSIAAYAPGRANLIGEHTDYNDGFVLPFALPYRTIIVAAKHTTSSLSTIYSVSKPNEPVTFDIQALSKHGNSWSNYVVGTIYQYLPDLPKDAAFNAVIISNVPLGSGLSSSAALEVATATLLEKLYNIQVDGVTKALRAQKSEHDFVGTPCGIMDQYISTMGKVNNLLLIDCRSKGYELVPFGGIADTSSPVILICNSNVHHELSGSEYPDRVRQCKAAVSIIQEKYPEVRALRDANLEMLQSVKKSLTDVEYRRARHIITEDDRVLETVKALHKQDFLTVGRLMTESHNSLRDDYEVSCVELDFLAATALKVPGVLGSRMTGGGFGGCTVTLVQPEAVERLRHFLEETYWKQCHLKCECYVAAPAEGCGYLDVAAATEQLARKEELSTASAAATAGDGASSAGATASALRSDGQGGQSYWVDYVVPGLVVSLAVVVGFTFLVKRRI